MKIQISKIHPNPNNPRKVITQQDIDGMAVSFGEVGQKNSIKVCPDGKGGFELISGHVRLLGAQKLGWTEIEAIILENLSEEEKMDIAMLDNLGKETFWLDLYIWIEARMAKSPDLTQKQVADRVAKSQQYVSISQKVLSLLGKSAREAIYQQLVKTPDWQVTMRTVIALTDIARGQADDQDRVERALKVVLDRQMTEQQVKKLVAWVRKGNTPESFPESGKTETVKGAKQQNFDPDDPYADLWQGLPNNVQAHKTTKGYKITINVADTLAPMAAYGAMAAVEGLKLKQRPAEAGNGNMFAEQLPSIYDRALGMAGEGQKSRGAEERRVGGSQEQRVGGSANAGSGVLNSGSSPVGMPISFSGIFHHLITAASNHAPKTISGKILKWIVMWVIGRLEGRKVGGLAKAEEQRNGKEGVSGKGNGISEAQIPNSGNSKLSNSRRTVVIVLIVAAGIFAMRIIPVIMHRMAASFIAQKPALMPAVTQISTASYAQAPVSVETTESKPAYKPAVKPKDKAISKKPHTEEVYAAATPSVPYDMSGEWKQAMKDFKQKNYEGALLWLGKAEDIYGDKPYICKYIADCKYNQSDFNEAEEYYKEYLEMNPGDKGAQEKIKKCESELALPPAPDGMEAGK